MTSLTKGCRIKFVSILVVVVIVRYGNSAPNPESKDDGKVGPKAKRSTSLVNFLSNMLQGYSEGSNGEWSDYNGYDDKYPQSDYDYEDNFIDYDDRSGNEEFSEVYDLNSGNNVPQQESREADPFIEWNYQYNEIPEEKPWYANDRGAKPHFYGHVRKNHYDHGPKSTSVDNDWNEVIPTERNVEIDEAVWKNVFMTPRKDAGLPSPSPRDTPVINWIDIDDHGVIYDKGPKFPMNKWFPEPPCKNCLEPGKVEPVAKDLKDQYLVFVVKKDQILVSDRNENKTETVGGGPSKSIFTILTCTKNETAPVRNTTVDATTENVIVGAGSQTTEENCNETSSSSINCNLSTTTESVITTTTMTEETTSAEPTTECPTTQDLSDQSTTTSTSSSTSTSTSSPTSTTESTTCTEPSSSTTTSTPKSTGLPPQTTVPTIITTELSTEATETTESSSTTESTPETTEPTPKPTTSSPITTEPNTQTTEQPTETTGTTITTQVTDSITESLTKVTELTTESTTVIGETLVKTTPPPTVLSTISTTVSPETTQSSPTTIGLGISTIPHQLKM